MKSRGFECVARADARVLILGTLPGKVSLERSEYYAQPRNAFWLIMGELAGASRDLPYKDRLRMSKKMASPYGTSVPQDIVPEAAIRQSSFRPSRPTTSVGFCAPTPAFA